MKWLSTIFWDISQLISGKLSLHTEIQDLLLTDHVDLLILSAMQHAVTFWEISATM